MRIDNNIRTGAAARGPKARGSAGAGIFEIVSSGSAPRAAATAAPSAPAAIDVLLALQAVGDERQDRRRQVRRGRSLLDALDAVKADLLIGRIGEGHLNQLLALLSQARERTDPGLDGLLDDIELRARVELAKRGVFPRS